jgi:hypothetical protein
MGPREAPEPDRDGLEWCHRCERWYNPKGPHGCVDDDVSDNRDRLEQWLGKGKYKVKEKD